MVINLLTFPYQIAFLRATSMLSLRLTALLLLHKCSRNFVPYFTQPSIISLSNFEAVFAVISDES